MNITRRRFLQGTAALFCAPAIIKADNLMRVATLTETHTYGMTVNANGVTMEALYSFLKEEWHDMGPGGRPLEGDFTYPETENVKRTGNKYGIIVDYNEKIIKIEKPMVIS